MGGSRCTYRNCSVRSDGIVHMFHYPVYDKIRCHQWLVNAHRLDFLNLKLSQVRNRVVCQHHFKDEYFMNYLKEKLTFHAIPTEDGPYCNSTKGEVLPVDQIARAYSAALNDEDNDKYSKTFSKVDRSMVYADFLTNGDVWEKQSLNETIWNNMVITPKEENKTNIIWNKSDELQASKKSKNLQSPLISLSDLIGDTSNTKITEFENPLLADMTFNENKDVDKNYDNQFYKNNEKSCNKNLSSSIIIQDSTNEIVNGALPASSNSGNMLVKRKNNNVVVNVGTIKQGEKNVGQYSGIKSCIKKIKHFRRSNRIESKQDLRSLFGNQVSPHVANREHNLIIQDVNLDNILVSQKDNNIIVNFDSLNQEKEVIVQDIGMNYNKQIKSLDSSSNIANQDSSSSLAGQKSIDIVAKQDHNIFLFPPTNMDNLTIRPKSNINTDLDNFIEPQDAVTEKRIEILPDQDFNIIPNQAKNTQSRQPLEIVTATKDYCAIIQNPNELAMEIESNNNFKSEEQMNHCVSINQSKENQAQIYQRKKKPKVTILSEKTILDPVIVNGQLEPLSPSAFLQLPKKPIIKSISDIETHHESPKISSVEIKDNENILPVKDVTVQKNMNNTLNIKKKCRLNDSLAKPLVVKHKIAPERVAAIEKKRKFNKRLIDIIEICLDKLEDQDKTNEEAIVADAPKVITPKPKSEKEKAKTLNQNISTYLSKQNELPNPQEYMMNFLEARMKKMEDTLLGKIEQNSQRIVDLKNSISNSPQANKATGTQTANNQESYKKQLYKEISQFLSPDANSLIYEELFINKYSQKLSNQSTHKKRKRR